VSLKPFRHIPTTLDDWSRWMKAQTIPVEADISITESQISDFGSYVTTATIMSGSGSPEGVITASPPCLYLNTDGGTSTTLYVKETGEDTNTGWIAK